MKKTKIQLELELDDSQREVERLTEEVGELVEGMGHMHDTINMLKRRNAALVTELDEVVEAKVS